MSIPKLTKDLAVIQKLSDLPNSTEGLTAAQLKAKFDEAPLEIQKWLNENLVPSITAENIPFPSSSEIEGDNLLAALKSVHTQVKDASTGAIVNGSVTMEKLSPELLERVYGGRPWVSMNTPTAEKNAQNGFPVGQIWLRPEFVVDNSAGNDWAANGCTVTGDRNLLTIKGNGTVANAYITQVLSNLGDDGDRVYVFVSPQNVDAELSSVTVSVNGEAGRPASQNVFEGTLSGGALTVRIDAIWPSTSLAVGSLDIANYAVVNVDRIVRQTGAEEVYNWASYLSALLPLDSYTSPEELYIQTINGQWWPFGKSVYPADRGGTGFDRYAKGELLVGAEDGSLQKMKAGEDGSVMRFRNGVPAWETPETLVADTKGVQIVTGRWTGNGSQSRTFTLPVTPVFLSVTTTASEQYNCRLFAQGFNENVNVTVEEGYTGGTLKLNGAEFSVSVGGVNHEAPFNRSGTVYNWVALVAVTG